MKKDMCDVCGEESHWTYFYNPDDFYCPHNADGEQGIEIYLCHECKEKYNEHDRNLVACVKATVHDNMVRVLEEECFYVEPDIKEWIKKHYKEESGHVKDEFCIDCGKLLEHYPLALLPKHG